MRLILNRLYEGKDCTIGVLESNDGLMCYTIERPWLDNKRNISSIPTGEYTCMPYSSQRYKNVWELQDVPGRSKILIHVANTASDVQGCIGVGDSIGSLGGKRAVLNSRVTLDKLRATIGTKITFPLVIK